MRKIVLFGNGKIADVLHSLLDGDPQLSIAGFTCDRAFVTGDKLHDLPLVAFEDVETTFPPSDYEMFVAIGYQDMNALRAERCGLARAKGYRLASWISPRANVPKSCVVGANCVVMDAATVQPYARLGDGVFVWSGAVVGHHATIGDYCWLASNSTVAGTTTLGQSCFVGVNAAIGQGISVGERAMVGAATVITRNTEPNGVYISRDTERYRLDSDRFMKIARLI